MTEDVPNYRNPILDQLGEPFTGAALKKKVMNNRSYTYVDHPTITRRLNSVVGEWSHVVKDVWFRNDLTYFNKTTSQVETVVTMVVLVELTIPGLGTRSGIGVQNIYPGSGEDQYKGAISDALKKASTLFGVALDLYGPDLEAMAPSQSQQPAPSPARPQNRQVPNSNPQPDRPAPNDQQRGPRPVQSPNVKNDPVKDAKNSLVHECKSRYNMRTEEVVAMLQYNYRKPVDRLTADELQNTINWIVSAPREEVVAYMREVTSTMARRAV